MCYGLGRELMVKVGLTGGIATGKSTVSRLLAEYGAGVIDADVLAREAVSPGQPALREIAATFGPGILSFDGTLNRERLAAIIFNDPAQRQRLEAIIHPYVFAEEERRFRQIVSRDPHALVIFDAALLIETGAYKHKERVIVVAADEQTQIARLQVRDGLSEAEARRRIAAQMPLTEKIKLAHYVIDGTLPMESLRREVKRVYSELKQLA
jgi:dephospho-CoA kinase